MSTEQQALLYHSNGSPLFSQDRIHLAVGMIIWNESGGPCAEIVRPVDGGLGIDVITPVGRQSAHWWTSKVWHDVDAMVREVAVRRDYERRRKSL